MDEKELKILLKKLPLTPGILRKEEYFNSSVMIPLVKINGEYHFLFEKRAAKIRQGGEVCFPGGEIDRLIDGDYKDTAIRETCEELGINKLHIKVLGQLDTLIGPAGITVDSYLGILKIKNIDKLKFGRNEVEKVFSIPVSYFLKNEPEKYYVRLEIHSTGTDQNGKKIETLPVKELNLPVRYSNSWGSRKHKVLVYTKTEEIIWGITATLIYEVISKIKGLN